MQHWTVFIVVNCIYGCYLLEGSKIHNIVKILMNVFFLNAEDLPVFALQDDRVVEVVGEPVGVHKGIELIASHLRKFLVDRSIIPVFEMHVSLFSSMYIYIYFI